MVDDHELFRESLSRLLQSEPGLHVIGDCGSVKEAFEILQNHPVDLVLLDYDLGAEDGLALLDETKLRRFGERVLIVTAAMDHSVTLRALNSGVCGIFFKHRPPALLIEAIRKVSGGEMWLDSNAVPSLLAAASRSTAAPDSDVLSVRERTVLKAVLEGLTNKEIAGRLEISESSVKAVLQKLFDKTGVRTRSQLVRIALEKHAAGWLAG